MKKIILILGAFIISSSILFAQKDFELQIPPLKVVESNYNRITYIDSRVNKRDFGFIYTTVWNKYTPIQENTPLAIQLQSLIKDVTEESAKDQTILFQLRDLSFSDGVKSDTPAYCHIRINLYQEYKAATTEYYYINRLDTLIASKKSNTILDEASAAITSFVMENLTTLPLDEVYTLDEVSNIDNIEKANLKVYQTDVYVDGVYPDYHSFANQTPLTAEMTCKTKDKELKEVKVKDATGEKWVKVKPQDVYAVVAEGVPYIAAGKKYCILYKNGMDFEFRTDESKGMRVMPNVSFEVGGGSGGGFVGGGIGIVFGSSPKEKITMIIDHLTGDFIPR